MKYETAMGSKCVHGTPEGSPCLLCPPITKCRANQQPPLSPMGCICPPTSEKTCQGPMCPRKSHGLGIVNT